VIGAATSPVYLYDARDGAKSTPWFGVVEANRTLHTSPTGVSARIGAGERG
jgi:hypothetical protein